MKMEKRKKKWSKRSNNTTKRSIIKTKGPMQHKLYYLFSRRNNQGHNNTTFHGGRTRWTNEKKMIGK